MSAQQRPVLSVVLVNLEGFFCLCDNCLIPEASRGEAATVSVSTFAGSPLLSLNPHLAPGVEIWNSEFESISHIFDKSSGNHTTQINQGNVEDLTSNRPTVIQALLLYRSGMSLKNKRGCRGLARCLYWQRREMQNFIRLHENTFKKAKIKTFLLPTCTDYHHLPPPAQSA